MYINQTVVSKKGSKVSPYNEMTEIIHKNLSSMIETNSHDYPEIKLDPSQIFFSGTEDSPLSMEVISTRFSVEFDYNQIFKEAFENCKADEKCQDKIPSKLLLTQLISDLKFGKKNR